MAVNLIIDRALNIEVKDPQFQNALEKLDAKKDGVINIDDFSVNEDKLIKYPSWFPNVVSVLMRNIEMMILKREKMHIEVAHVLYANSLINKQQFLGVIELFDLYNDVRDTNTDIVDWMKNHVDTWGYELEFDKDYFLKNVRPIIYNRFYTTEKPLYKTKISSNAYLNVRLHDIVYNLSGVRPDEFHSPTNFCGTYQGSCMLNTVEYIVDDIPEIFRPAISDISSFLISTSAMLKGYGNMQCDGEGCSPNEYGYYHFYVLRLREGSHLRDLFLQN